MGKKTDTAKLNEDQKPDDLISGSIVKNLVKLSWPIIISYTINLIGPTIDMIWVGKLGTEAIAGVGASGMIVMLISSAMMGLNIGTRALVARFIGAGEHENARHVVNQSFMIGVVLSIVFIYVGILFAEKILGLLGIEKEVVAVAVPYMRIMFFTSSILIFRFLTETTMQASGDSVTPMRISILFRVIHVIVCPFMVLGWWVFPRMGVSGAAYANAITQGLALIISFWILYAGRTSLKLKLENIRIDLNMMWRIVKVGIPAAVMSSQRMLGLTLLLIIMARFGTLAVAAHTIWMRIEVVMVPLVVGWGIGSGVIAGQNMGAGNSERAEKTGWIALGFGQIVMVIASIVLIVFPGPIVSIFSSDPALSKITVNYLRIASVGYLAGLSMVMVIREVLAGVGDTLPPMIFEIINMWVILLPLALLIPGITELGMYGPRWAITIGTMINGFAILLYFRMGRWKRKRV
jgi:putative MATE family efflux protein